MGKRGSVIVAVAVLLAFFGLVPAFAAGKALINGFDAAYPPFTFIDKTGQPAGFDIDAVNWIAKEMGFKVVHKATDWAAIVPSLKAKKIDFIASGMNLRSDPMTPRPSPSRTWPTVASTPPRFPTPPPRKPWTAASR